MRDDSVKINIFLHVHFFLILIWVLILPIQSFKFNYQDILKFLENVYLNVNNDYLEDVYLNVDNDYLENVYIKVNNDYLENVYLNVDNDDASPGNIIPGRAQFSGNELLSTLTEFLP